MTNIELLDEQGISAFINDPIVKDLYEVFGRSMNDHFMLITSFYYAGLINGKRIERAKRKKGGQIMVKIPAFIHEEEIERLKRIIKRMRILCGILAAALLATNAAWIATEILR